MWIVLSAAVVLACSLLTLVTHRLVVEGEQESRTAWMRTQAQGLGHGAVMWSLARMEDHRPLDSRCHPVRPDGQASRFAELAIRAGTRVSCTVDLGPDAPASAAEWNCRCPALEQEEPTEHAGSERVALIAMDFTAAGSQTLVLQVTATVAHGSATALPWRETIQLRQDARAVWRAVVGTWWDARG